MWTKTLGMLSVLATAALAHEPPCTGQRAHCVLPPAATVPWNRAAILDDRCDAPRASCLRPAAHRVLPPPPRCATLSAPSVHEVLAHWEAASAQRPLRSEREREWLRRQAGDRLSAHALDLVWRLTQPVTVQALQDEFDWQLTSRDAATTITLSATPRDDTTQLFCRELQVEFDPARGAPVSVHVVPRRAQRAVGTASGTVMTADFVTVDEELALPPSPSRTSVVRLASGVVEFEAPR